MKEICPNYSSPDWKTLEAALGRAAAESAYEFNKREIPTVDEARVLLSNAKIQEKDEQYARSSDSNKLKRAKDQMLMLEASSENANGPQKETLDKLMAMNRLYQEFLNTNLERIDNGQAPIRTLSVSALLGGSEFTGDAKVYESFKLFGTFMHEVIELASVEALKSGLSVQKVMTKEFFDSSYANYGKKTPFTIQDFSETMMYDAAVEIVNKIPSNGGHIIVPELTVMGTNRNQARILGRVDLTIIDRMGRVKIFDFKTKKVTELVVFEKGKAIVRNADLALLNIAQQTHEVSNTEEVMIELAGTKRSEYEKWTQQLKTYENILLQSGVTVASNTIVSFLYQTTVQNPEAPTDPTKYLGSIVQVFDEKNFFDYAKTVSNPDTTGFWHNETLSNKKLENTLKLIDAEIPTKESDSYDALIKSFKKMEFDVPGSQNARLLQGVKNLIAAEQQQLDNEIMSTKSNPEFAGTLKILEGRKTALLLLDEVLNSEGREEQIAYSLNFSIVMEQVEDELSRLMELSEIAVAEFRGQAFSKSNDQIKTVTVASAKARALFSIIQLLRETITEAKENPANNLTEDSAVMKKLSLIDSYTESLAANMREIGLATAMGTIKSVTSEKGFKKVKGELDETIVNKIAELNKKLDALRAGKSGGPLSYLKNKSLLFMSPRYKKLLAEKLGPLGEGLVKQIQKVELDIKKQERLLHDGFNYDDASLIKYLEGSGDQNQDWSIGVQNLFVPDGMMSSMSIDKMQASVSSKDLLTSSQVQALKNAYAEGTREMMRNMAELEVDQRLAKMRALMSIDQLNDLLSETQARSYMNFTTGEIETTNVLQMNRHYGVEYANKFSDFKNNMFVFRKELKDLKMIHNTAVKVMRSTTKTISDVQAAQDVKNAMQALTEKIAQRDAATDEHLKFKIQHSSLEYVPRFYEVQVEIPEAIRQQIQYKYLEIEAILFNVGSGNEAELEDDDYNEMEQLRDDVRVLRNDAKKLNAKYGDYIDELAEFFEFGVDEQRFEKAKAKAKVKYAEQPALWDKWNKENTVNRPNTAWYERLNELNETRSAIYKALEASGSSMPFALGPNGETFSELMAEYRSIVKPHKKDGRINPQFLTKSELKELATLQATMDEIQQATEEMRAGKKGERPSEDIRHSLNLIKAELEQISKKQISPAYLKEFDDEHNRLMNALRQKNQALAERALAITAADPIAIDKANEDLAFADNQFAIVEDSFEAWYNSKHSNKYLSITEGYDVKSMKQPKAFNFEKLPAEEVYDKYMDLGVPSGKYGVKTIRPEAINNDFLMSPEGIPMPNNIQLDAKGNYEVTPGRETERMKITKLDGTMVDAQLANEKFLKMTQNKEVHDFYNDITRAFWLMQSKLQGRKIGYDIPGFAATAVENISRVGMLKAMELSWDNFVDKNLTYYGEQDIVDNMYGDDTSNIRQRFTRQLPENLQTKDSIGAILMYMVEGNYNIAMQKVAPQAEATIEFMKIQASDLSRQIQAKTTTYTDENGEIKRVNMERKLKDLTRSIEILEFERDKFLYGKTVKIESAADRKMHKVVNGMFAYASFIRIGFDIANQAKNYLSGNVQAFIAAGGVAGDHYTRKDYMFAKNEVYKTGGFLSNYFSDWGKINDVHESTNLYRMFNPAMKDFMKYMSDVTDSKGRRVMGKLMHVTELGYVLQDKGDTEIAVTVMYAVLNSYKFAKIAGVDPTTGDTLYELDAEGKQVMVPAHQAYVQDPKTGMLVRSASVEYSQQDEDRLRHIVYSEMRRAQGNYSGQDKTQIESTLGGKLMFFFKKYLIPQFLNRFGYIRPNWEAEEVAVGYWRAVNMALKQFGPRQIARHMLLGSKHMNATDQNTMGPLFTRKVHQAKRDAIAMFILSALGMLAITYMKKKKDDDEELTVLEGNAIRILWGVKGETMSMLPIGSGADEYIRNFTTLTTGTRELTGLWRMANHASDLGLAMIMGGGVEPDPALDSAAYQSAYKGAFYSKKTGSYEAGDPKLMKDLFDFTGIKNIRGLINPGDRLTNVN